MMAVTPPLSAALPVEKVKELIRLGERAHAHPARRADDPQRGGPVDAEGVTLPATLAELVKVFDQEARRNSVYPIAPYCLPQPSPAAGRTSFTYPERVTRLPLRAAPDLSGRSYSFTADIEIPQRGRGRDLRRRRTPRRIQPLPQGRQDGVRAQHFGQDT
jgi:hypothetical protein